MILPHAQEHAERDGVKRMSYVKVLARAWIGSLTNIFSFQDDESRGRVIALTSTLLTTFYNVFITGIFYTGFLSMYGMSITDAGILTFIPYIANLLSVFSPKLLGRFAKRKKLLLTAKVIYYAIYIVVATVMPQFVTDPDQRLILFIIIQAVAAGFYAFFGSGFTIWFYNFYPLENDRRIRYVMLSQIFSSILSSLVLIGSGLLTDALSGSPFQDQLILIFRYCAFALVLLDVFFQSKAKEYPYVAEENTRLHEVFTLPFKNKKFFACMILMFLWNFNGNLNNGLWGYHLLNHLDFSYTLINAMSVLYTIVLLCLSPVWNKVLRRYSWIKTFGIATLLFVPTEVICFSLMPGDAGMYVVASFFQNVMSVGLNLAYSNILYMNLPKEKSTTYITFNTIGCNIFAFFGLMTGTWVSGITGDSTISMLGLEVYSVQFTCLMRGIFMAFFGLVLVLKWRIFTRDEDIAEVEHLTEVSRRKRKQDWEAVQMLVRQKLQRR